MKRITSDALVLLNRMLGLAGGSPGVTELDDGNVSQVLEISPVVRRSSSPAGSTGWFFGVMSNIHAGAGLIETTINPFNVGALQRNAYPSRIPRNNDLWLYSACLLETVETGAALDAGVLYINPNVVRQGWGVDSVGTFVSGTDPMPLARWTSVDGGLAGRPPVGVGGDGSALIVINQRLVRDVDLLLRTDATAAGAFRCYMTFGLFTEGLGQDIAQ